jgi:hypothetical protein
MNCRFVPKAAVSRRSCQRLPIIITLSLAILRRRIEERLIGEDVDVKLVLDHAERQARPAPWGVQCRPGSMTTSRPRSRSPS